MGNYSDNRLEKFYTTETLTNHLWDRLNEFKDINTISSFMENSAGDGRMVDFLKDKCPDKEVYAYDIHNETGRDDIIECDYLKNKKIEYKEGRVAFINPPFNKGLKFVYKSLEEGDYCISILSINSFLNLDYNKYDVDFIDIIKKADFNEGTDESGECNVGICIMGVFKK